MSESMAIFVLGLLMGSGVLLWVGLLIQLCMMVWRSMKRNTHRQRRVISVIERHGHCHRSVGWRPVRRTV